MTTQSRPSSPQPIPSVFVFDLARVILFPSERTISPVSSYYHRLTSAGSLSDVIMNTQLLDRITSLKTTSTTAILTASTILKTYQPLRTYLEPYFDHFFLSKELGLSKDQPALYAQVGAKLTVEPHHIFFTDDQEVNVLAAHQAGWQATVFESTPQLIHVLDQLSPNI